MEMQVSKYEAELINHLRNPLNAKQVVKGMEMYLERIPDLMTYDREAATITRTLAHTIAR